MVIISTECWKCGQEMKVTMIENKNGDQVIHTSEFSQEDIDTAVANGAIIEKVHSKTINSSYYANVCNHCKAFVGKNYMHEYYYLPPEKEIDIGYKCFYCKDMLTEQD